MIIETDDVAHRRRWIVMPIHSPPGSAGLRSVRAVNGGARPTSPIRSSGSSTKATTLGSKASKLILIVSLEAIFLSIFVMIGQNRQAAFQQAKADHDFSEQELELKTNTELTRQIHLLTTELHRRLLDEPAQ